MIVPVAVETRKSYISYTLHRWHINL